MNSWFTNPHIENNKSLYERLKAMSPEQLKIYYDTVEYMRKRNGSK